MESLDDRSSLTQAQITELDDLVSRVKSVFGSDAISQLFTRSQIKMVQLMMRAFTLQVREERAQTANWRAKYETLRYGRGVDVVSSYRMEMQTGEETSLKVEVARLKQSMAKMTSDGDLQKTMTKKEVVKHISEKLKIETTCESERELIAVLRQSMENADLVTSGLIREFELPKGTKPRDMVDELKRKMNIKEREVAGAVEIAELASTVESQKAQLKSLKHNMKKASSSHARMHEDQDRYERLISEMKKQYDDQSAELVEVSKHKATLAASVQRLMETNLELERQVASKTELASVVPRESMRKEAEIVTALKGVRNTEITEICKGEDVMSRKIDRIVDVTNRIIDELDYKEARTDALLAVVLGQFKFMNMLMASEQLMESFVPMSIGFEGTIAMVEDQVERLKDSLDSFAAGYTGEACVFEALLKKGTTTDLVESMKTYIEHFGSPQTREGEQLFLMFVQSLAANSVLRKLSDDAQRNCSKQAEEIKNLKAFSAGVRSRCEAERESMTVESTKQVDGILTSARSIIRGLVLHGKASKEVLTSLDALNQVAEIDDDKYIKSLEKRNASLERKLRRVRQENASVFEQTRESVDDFEHRLASVAAKCKEESERDRVARTHIESTLEERDQTIVELRWTNGNLQDTIARLKSDLESAHTKFDEREHEVRSLISDIQSQANSTRMECENLLDCAREQNDTIRANDKIQFAETEKALKAENKRLRRVIKEHGDDHAAVTSQLRTMCDDNSDLVKREEEILARISEVNAKYKRVCESLKNMKRERRMFGRQMQEKDERGQRSSAIVESQMKIKIMDAETQAAVKIDEVKAEFGRMQQDLLVSISRGFHGYVDVNQPLTISSIGTALERVRLDLADVPRLRDKERILTNIVSAVGVRSDQDVVDHVRQLVHDMSGSSDFELWIGRVFRVCCGSHCQAHISTAEKMRYIEENLFRGPVSMSSSQANARGYRPTTIDRFMFSE